MKEQILFRAVIEVLGKPKEHVENALQGYVRQLKENKRYTLLKEEYAELKKQQDQELWATFVEVEVRAAAIEDLTAFCFDYMPSLIEIIEPPQLTMQDSDLSVFLNDLQAKLHQVDMIAKSLRLENNSLKEVVNKLLQNYVILLLGKKPLSSQQLSALTGVAKDKLEDFLDKLIDEGKIDLKEGEYFRITHEAQPQKS